MRTIELKKAFRRDFRRVKKGCHLRPDLVLIYRKPDRRPPLRFRLLQPLPQLAPLPRHNTRLDRIARVEARIAEFAVVARQLRCQLRHPLFRRLHLLLQRLQIHALFRPAAPRVDLAGTAAIHIPPTSGQPGAGGNGKPAQKFARLHRLLARALQLLQPHGPIAARNG